MDTNKTGGAAFPNLKRNINQDGSLVEVLSDGGMTLLDYFAAKAMERSPHNVYEYAETAEYAYKQAAAMLKERQKHIS